MASAVGITRGGPTRERSSRRAKESRPPLAVWLLALGLAANMFSGHTDQLGLPIGLDRILLPAALVLALLDRRARWWRLRSAHLFMFAFAAWATANWLWIGHNDGIESFFTLLDRIYIPFLLFTIAPYFLGTATRRRLLLATLTVMGVYLTFTTIAEALGFTALLFPRYIAENKEVATLGTSAEEAARAGGPFLFGEPNGMVLAICAYAALLLASKVSGPWRVVALVTAPLALIASIATMTRSIWLGVALGLLCMSLTNWRWFAWLPVAILLGALGLAAGAAIFPELAADAATRAGTSRSLWDRVTTNEAAVRIIMDRPLTGIGWQQFVQIGPGYARQADLIPLANTNIEVHNVFLARGAELGIPGLVLYVMCLVTGPVAALTRRVRRDLVGWQLVLLGAFVVWFVVSMTSPNPYPLPTFLVWLLAGFVVAAPPYSEAVGAGSAGVPGAGVLSDPGGGTTPPVTPGGA